MGRLSGLTLPRGRWRRGPFRSAARRADPRPLPIHPRSLCRCGSDQGFPLVASALCRVPPPHQSGPAVAELPRPAMSDPPHAPAGQPAQGSSAVLRRRAPSRCPGTPRRWAWPAHPRQETCHGCEGWAGPVEDSASFGNPRQETCHGPHGRRLAEAGGPSGRPARFFPVRIWGGNREKISFFAQRRSTLWT